MFQFLCEKVHKFSFVPEEQAEKVLPSQPVLYFSTKKSVEYWVFDILHQNEKKLCVQMWWTYINRGSFSNELFETPSITDLDFMTLGTDS